ncbi:hypothetical protein BpHYR1_032407 [Brachionus plicatilis]|uniref:RNA-directed DNA polymerase from mobile element jockey-like n=1 Tax=Brachionus plicatilis TaxID=10195 RepID=A0A3M7PBR8_BRAPC|nr:hypothetical protein BpHYR1_032407 [Brachionus plicatilis]
MALFQFITRPRNKFGGGEAILIKEGIEFIQDLYYKELNCELLCIKMNLRKNYILGGDLNARTKQIGCVGEYENGIMLERIINDFILLIDKITDFCVLNSQDMTSVHFPIEASIYMGYQLENKSEAKKFYYEKANWQLFSEILKSQIENITESSLTIDQLKDKITEKIISSSHKSTPYLSQKIYKTSLPPNIVNLIKERRKEYKEGFESRYIEYPTPL